MTANFSAVNERRWRIAQNQNVETFQRLFLKYMYARCCSSLIVNMECTTSEKVRRNLNTCRSNMQPNDWNCCAVNSNFWSSYKTQK